MPEPFPPSLTPCGPCSVGEHSDCESIGWETRVVHDGSRPCPCWTIGHSTRFYGGEDRRGNYWSAGTPGPSRGAIWQENVLATAAAVATERTQLIATIANVARETAKLEPLQATVELVLIEFAARMVSPRGAALVERMTREARQPQDAPPQSACPLCAHPMGDHSEHGCDFAGEFCDCQVHVLDFTPQDADPRKDAPR